MIQIKDTVFVSIEESGALGEIFIPAFELNDLRRERDEYLSQTASDLYDRVVYMVRTMKDPVDDAPQVQLRISMGDKHACCEFWEESRRGRQNKLKQMINQLFDQLVKPT